VNASAFEVVSLVAGMQNVWHMTAEGWDERMAAVRHDYAANLDGDAPTLAQGNSLNGFLFVGQNLLRGIPARRHAKRLRAQLRHLIQQRWRDSRRAAIIWSAMIPAALGFGCACRLQQIDPEVLR